jgi:hypothetical protein
MVIERARIDGGRGFVRGGLNALVVLACSTDESAVGAETVHGHELVRAMAVGKSCQ